MQRIEVPPEKLPDIGGRAWLRVDGGDIALFNVMGVLYAIDDSCPHAGSSLLSGRLSGRTVQCPAHGLRFDLLTGCMSGGSLAVRAYRVEICDGRTFLMLPATAEPSC
jgi:3-phenylpropionate/trans-cinnamate dioxygenase ferredoxin subunit